MRIALNGIPLLTPLTGIGHYTHELARHMLAAGHELVVFEGVGWRNGLPPEENVGGMTVKRAVNLSILHQIKRFFGRVMPGGRWLARRLMQWRYSRDEPACVVAFEPNFVPFRSQAPVVVTIHDLSFIHYPETHPGDRVRFMTSGLPGALRMARRVITVSDCMRRELVALYPEAAEKIVVIHNGVNHDPVTGYCPRSAVEVAPALARYGLRHRGYWLLVGTLEPRKNIGVAIKAHAALPHALRMAFPLVLVGAAGWKTSAFSAQLAAGERQGAVRVLGYLPDEDCRHVVAGAFAMLYPSLYEGFGLPPLEAMACAVPVVASMASAMPEVLGEAALLCDPRSPADFTAAMLVLHDAPDRWQQLAQAGYQRAAGYSWACAAKETLAVLAEAAAT